MGERWGVWCDDDEGEGWFLMHEGGDPWSGTEAEARAKAKALTEGWHADPGAYEARALTAADNGGEEKR